MTKSLKTVLIFLFIFAGSNSCRKDYTSIVPYMIVNYSFNPTSYIELNIPGGSVFFGGIGYGGIIVFRDLTDSSNPFTAYDATCTNEVSSTCRALDPDATGVATCKCCGSQYILFSGNGSPTKGPATQPLKQYRTSYSGGLVYIRN